MPRLNVPRFFKRPIVVIGLVVTVGTGAYFVSRAQAEAAGGQGGPGGGGGGGGFGGGGFGGFGGGGPRLPMTVEMAPVARGEVSATIQVVGNLIGLQTVEATPKVQGRLLSVDVRLGDRVARGQRIAKVEDSEIGEQVKQAQAAYEVSQATIRQRQADLKLAQTNLDRSRNLFDRQLIPRQTLDDTDARYQAAVAQLDLANAQNSQSRARLDELSINFANTVISSPLSGVVARRLLDPGGWVTPQSAFVTVVDISIVRLVASVVEKDIRLVTPGMPVSVEVDAFPGERFQGKVAHVAPVLDPTTRTAQIEVEIGNKDLRLRPGMYAKVNLTTERHAGVLVVPTTALVDQGDQRGVFLAAEGPRGQVARFQPVETGLMDQTTVEITRGLDEGQEIVTTGAGALREGDQIVLPGQAGQRGQGGAGQGQGGGQGRRGQGGRNGGAAPGGAAPEGAAPGGGNQGGGQGGGQRGGGQRGDGAGFQGRGGQNGAPPAAPTQN